MEIKGCSLFIGCNTSFKGIKFFKKQTNVCFLKLFRVPLKHPSNNGPFPC